MFQRKNMLRVFIAINLPKEIKRELAEIAENIKNSFPFEIGKWVELGNFHITLLFLGAVKEENLPNIIEQTKNSCRGIKPFKVKINKILYEPPSPLRDAENFVFSPRLIWFQGENNPEMEKLSLNLRTKRFVPHITICRIKNWLWKRIEPEERPDIEQELDIEFEVKSIEVMESRLKREGPEYNIIESVNLLD